MTIKQELTRRQFGQALVAGTVVAAVGVPGCHDYRASCPSGPAGNTDPLDGYHPLFLGRTECITLAAAAEVLIADCPPVISPGEVAKRADQYLALANNAAARKMKLALLAVEASPAYLLVGVPTFSSLSLDKRREVVGKLARAEGTERDLARVLKLLTTFSYYSHPEARRAVGFVDFERRPRFNPLPVFTQPNVYPEPEHFG
jgi:hypothetical protein